MPVTGITTLFQTVFRIAAQNHVKHVRSSVVLIDVYSTGDNTAGNASTVSDSASTLCPQGATLAHHEQPTANRRRSEERRVGKASRSRVWCTQAAALAEAVVWDG